MSKELEKVRELFLVDVDEETRTDNLQKIAEWEKSLVENQAYASWLAHDITKQIASKARDTYKEATEMLSTSRTLTDEQRQQLWAKQDASLWMLGLLGADAVSEIKKIHAEIRFALLNG